MIRALQARCCQTLTSDFCLQPSPPNGPFSWNKILAHRSKNGNLHYVIKEEKELKHPPQLETVRAQCARSECELRRHGSKPWSKTKCGT